MGIGRLRWAASKPHLQHEGQTQETGWESLAPTRQKGITRGCAFHGRHSMPCSGDLASSALTQSWERSHLGMGSKVPSQSCTDVTLPPSSPATSSLGDWRDKDRWPSPSRGCPGPGIPSQQKTDVSFLLSLGLLEGTKGDLGGLSEHILHVLPEFGRTLQVQGCLHLLTGTLTLGVGDGF